MKLNKTIRLEVTPSFDKTVSATVHGTVEGTPEKYIVKFDAILLHSLDRYTFEYENDTVSLFRKGEMSLNLYIKRGERTVARVGTPFGVIETGYCGRRIVSQIDKDLNGTLECTYATDRDWEEKAVFKYKLIITEDKE